MDDEDEVEEEDDDDEYLDSSEQLGCEVGGMFGLLTEKRL